MPDDIKLPEPYGHVYEYDTGFELHWSFYPDRWNGMPPTRTVPVYTADQVRAAVEADRATRSPAANFALARKMGAAHLSDPEMRDTLADLKRRINTEPGFKRALLQSAGIVDDDGNLTPLYRGGDAEAAHGIPHRREAAMRERPFHERKAERSEHYHRYVRGWKLRDCTACAGSGRYDHNGSPRCGACAGTGRERYKPEPQEPQR